MRSRFVVLSPPYTDKSAGVVALFRLANKLKQLGEDVLVCLFSLHENNLYFLKNKTEWVLCDHLTLTREFSGENYIFIVPEVVDARWLSGLKVARYYLNKIGVLGHGENISSGEFKVAFSKMFCEPPFFYLPQYLGKVDLNFAKSINRDGRQLNLTYIGKGEKYLKNPSVINGTVLMTRTWPPTREQYVTLLANTNLVFSYDPLTSTLMDAVLLGAIPVILNFHPFTEDEIISMDNQFPFFAARKSPLKIDFNQFKMERIKYIEKNIVLSQSFGDGVLDFVAAVNIFFGFDA
jgi:hypothetical protein